MLKVDEFDLRRAIEQVIEELRGQTEMKIDQFAMETVYDGD